MSEPEIDVLVVGGGPAGLAAALELRRVGVARVMVVDREREAGGVPRHTAHTGFGLRDLHRLLSGPRYAARYVALAEAAGASLRTGTSVTAWTGPCAVGLTSAAGVETARARAIVLATGCRERPRAARLVPGARPAGVFTTGTLQQMVYLRRQPIGRRAVVVGAEHVSYSAVQTLAHGGATAVAMVTEHPRHQTFAAFRWVAAARRGVPLLTAACVTRIIGRRRVEAVEVTDLAGGGTREIACDTVVFTGDWIPDHELARRGGLAMDPATRAPRVDEALRTSARGVFAAGNLVHPAEAADVAALGGRHAAHGVLAFLDRGAWPQRAALPVLCEPPLAWASPSAIVDPRAPLPRGRFLLRTSAFRPRATLELRQDDRVLWQRRYRTLVPTRPIRAAVADLSAVDPHGGALRFALAGEPP